jgi:hypothetical protein
VLDLMGLALPASDHSTLSRRQRDLPMGLPTHSVREPIYVVVVCPPIVEPLPV